MRQPLNIVNEDAGEKNCSNSVARFLNRSPYSSDHSPVDYNLRRGTSNFLEEERLVS